MPDDGHFCERLACVTGGARGLGANTVEALARGGAHVFVGDVLAREGEDLTARLRAEGLSASYHQLDVTSEDDWRSLANAIESRAGRLDVLVNNAGIIIRKGLSAMTRAEWERAFSVNVTGVFLGMQHCRALLAQASGASIVDVSSISGLIAHSDPSYTASKWAVRGLTKSAALELVQDGIRGNSVHPATIATPLTQAAPAGHLEANRHAIPMGRELEPDEIANVVTFLASRRSSFMTGSEVAVDGGLTTGGVAHMRADFQRRLAGGEI